MISLKKILSEATLTEKKYYVTYNLGRGRGKDLEKEFDQKTFKTTNKPKVFNSYNDAKKYAEKMEKMFQHSIGGGTAYWVSDEKMNPIKEGLDPKAQKFLDAIQVIDRDIKDLKNITVDATPQGNWSVYFKGKRMGTINGKMLDDSTIMKYGLEESVSKSITEAKSDYEVYHKSYTSAIQAAKEYAEKKGYEINDDDSFRQIGMGPRKPSEGKTNKFSIELSKDGKVQRKKLQIQVYGMRNSYELNAYIQ
jgi:hypothetical protein